MKITRFAPHLSTADEVVRKFCAKNFKRPFSVEMLYLPFVLFKYAVETTRFFGKKTASEGLFLADLIQGVPVNIRKGTTFRVEPGLGRDLAVVLPSPPDGIEKTAETIAIEAKEVSPCEVLPVLLEEAEAMARGKRLLRYDLMRLAGGLRYLKVEIALYPETELVYYPYWLVYYRGRRGEMKCVVMDAVNGNKETEEIVQSVKMGLLRKKRAVDRLESGKGADHIDAKTIMPGA